MHYLKPSQEFQVKTDYKIPSLKTKHKKIQTDLTPKILKVTIVLGLPG